MGDVVDSDRFDGWTRRRFGLGIGGGGIVAGLLALAAPPESDAKKSK